jgi:hypothetical protein
MKTSIFKNFLKAFKDKRKLWVVSEIISKNTGSSILGVKFGRGLPTPGSCWTES